MMGGQTDAEGGVTMPATVAGFEVVPMDQPR